MHDRRCALAEAEDDGHAAQVAGPLLVALHVVAVHAARTERHIDLLAVGHRRCRGVAAVGMVPLVRHFFLGRVLPQRLARAAVDAHHDELIKVFRPLDVESRLGCVGRQRLEFDGAVGLDGGCQKNLVSPHDRRGRARAGNFHLPLDVRFFIPLDRRIGQRRHAVGQRPAPLRPVLLEGHRLRSIRSPGRPRGQHDAPGPDDRFHESGSLSRGLRWPRCNRSMPKARGVRGRRRAAPTTYHAALRVARPAGLPSTAADAARIGRITTASNRSRPFLL